MFLLSSTEEAVSEATKCWDAKLNCAESVLRGVCHAQRIGLPDAAKRMATPFGGGVGRSEDLCGALAGGVMALGASIGRVSPDEDRLRSYDAAGKLFTGFSVAGTRRRPLKTIGLEQGGLEAVVLLQVLRTKDGTACKGHGCGREG